MIELIFVVVIAAIMAGIALPQMTKYMSSRAVVNARDGFGMMAARARSAAVERGDVVVFRIQPTTDIVLITSRDGSDTIDVLNFARGERPVDLLAGAALAICYVPRGFAHPGCGSGGQLPQDVGFRAGKHTIWSEVNALGQVQRK